VMGAPLTLAMTFAVSCADARVHMTVAQKSVETPIVRMRMNEFRTVADAFRLIGEVQISSL